MTTTKNTRGTRKLAEDDPRHGATAQPPLLMLIIGALEIAAWLWCNNQQIATTHDAVFGLLQSSTILPSHATASLVMTILQDNLDKNNKIAYSIAIVAPTMFLISAFPTSRIWGRMAQCQSYHPSRNSFKPPAPALPSYINTP